MQLHISPGIIEQVEKLARILRVTKAHIMREALAEGIQALTRRMQAELMDETP